MFTNLSNKAYDRLKHVTQVVLPAAGALYFGLSQIWGFPAGEEVVGSLALMTTFGGVVLTKSSKEYAEDVAGDLVIDRGPSGQRAVQFQWGTDPRDVQHGDRVVFHAVETALGSNEEFWMDNPAAE